MSAITTHVLDAVLGKPAANIAVRLEEQAASGWLVIGESATNNDGRCRDLCDHTNPGTYRLTFGTAAYFTQHNRGSIYPEITITFVVDGITHYHIPLLLSDNSYTTYRGS